VPDESQTYGRIVGRNISGARGQRQLTQTSVAVRMRALGFDWHQQTVASVEKGRRRVTAEEIFGLALALETTMPTLLRPTDPDVDVVLPSGVSLAAVSVLRLSGPGQGRGFNDKAVRWEEGDEPTFYKVPESLGESWASTGDGAEGQR
jgi:transcriptional regulator with XRE-family HTH domain